MTGTAATDEQIWLPISEVAAAGGVRRAAVALAAGVGLPEAVLGKVAIVASEVATNLARHADRGTVLLRPRRATAGAGLEILAFDHGPGIADVAESIRDGHSTAGTLGIGLGAIERLTDELDIYSIPGRGTVLAATLWPGKPPGDTGWMSGIRRPIAGEDVCGDGYAGREFGTRRQVMLCDGLGHGELASRAAIALADAFLGAPEAGPRDVLVHMSQRVRHTRGAVAAVVELDQDRVRFAGVGNIAGSVVDAADRRVMVSLPGIVGHQHRDIREYDYPTADGAYVVLHSDGVSDRWRIGDYPGLLTHTPVVVAGTLMRDMAYRRDDAAVLAARA